MSDPRQPVGYGRPAGPRGRPHEREFVTHAGRLPRQRQPLDLRRGRHPGTRHLRSRIEHDHTAGHDHPGELHRPGGRDASRRGGRRDARRGQRGRGTRPLPRARQHVEPRRRPQQLSRALRDHRFDHRGQRGRFGWYDGWQRWGDLRGVDQRQPSRAWSRFDPADPDSGPQQHGRDGGRHLRIRRLRHDEHAVPGRHRPASSGAPPACRTRALRAAEGSMGTSPPPTSRAA